MDYLAGMQGDGYVLMLADRMAVRSIQVFKNDEDKIMNLDKHKMLGGAGPVGDRNEFCEYIQKNLALKELRSGFECSVSTAANFTRSELADSIRRNPFQVNLLLGGVDKKGPALYYMDYLGSMCQIPFGAHGYGGFFTLSIFDRYYKSDMTVEEGIELMKRCIQEMQTRFLVNMSKFICKIADKDGVREIDLGDLGHPPVVKLQEQKAQ